LVISVQCQSSIEKQVRANLTQLVKFVVGPLAEPNTDLINMAFASGGSPKTQAERAAYLQIMKQIARNTPSVTKNFTTTITKPDGTKVESLDGMRMDAQITMRALQYVATSAPVAPTNGSLSITTTTSTARVPTKPVQAYPTNMGGTGLFSNTIQNELDGIRKTVQNQVKKSRVSTSQDGTVSLLDLFNMNRALVSIDSTQNNMNNEMGFF